MAVKKNQENSYEEYISKALQGIGEGYKPSEELLKAEPDLAAFVEPQMSDELRTAIEVIQDGALQHFSATQQKIFQLSIVEGMIEKEVLKTLDINRDALNFHLKYIGDVLRRKCEKRLRDL